MITSKGERLSSIRDSRFVKNVVPALDKTPQGVTLDAIISRMLVLIEP